GGFLLTRKPHLAQQKLGEQVDEHFKPTIPVNIAVFLSLPPMLLNRAEQFALQEGGLSRLRNKIVPNPPRDLIVGSCKVDHSVCDHDPLINCVVVTTIAPPARGTAQVPRLRASTRHQYRMDRDTGRARWVRGGALMDKIRFCIL